LKELEKKVINLKELEKSYKNERTWKECVDKIERTWKKVIKPNPLKECVDKINATFLKFCKNIGIDGEVSGIDGEVSGIDGEVSGIDGEVSGIDGEVSLIPDLKDYPKYQIQIQVKFINKNYLF
jgi:archaellum component FlaC